MKQYAARVDLRQMRYFVAVATNRSFRKAAELLNISQPPLTRQIQQLEEEIGTALLLRQSGGVELTAAGAAFFTEARNILNLVDNACSNANLIGIGQLGQMDVGVFGSAVLDIVPRIVVAFRARYPSVEVILHNMDRATQIKALQDRRILIGFNRFFLDHPDLVWEPVVREKMLVVAPSDHPLASRQSVRLTDLAGQPLIFYPRTSQPGGFANYLFRIFHRVGVEPVVVQHVDDVVAAVAFVSSGLGLTLGVESARNLQLPGVTYVPLSDCENADSDLSIIYRANDDSRLLGQFLETVRETFPPPASR